MQITLAKLMFTWHFWPPSRNGLTWHIYPWIYLFWVADSKMLAPWRICASVYRRNRFWMLFCAHSQVPKQASAEGSWSKFCSLKQPAWRRLKQHVAHETCTIYQSRREFIQRVTRTSVATKNLGEPRIKSKCSLYLCSLSLLVANVSNSANYRTRSCVRLTWAISTRHYLPTFPFLPSTLKGLACSLGNICI